MRTQVVWIAGDLHSWGRNQHKTYPTSEDTSMPDLDDNWIVKKCPMTPRSSDELSKTKLNPDHEPLGELILHE